MKFVLKILTNRWLISILGLVFLACIIWLLGPLISIGEWRPLATGTAQLVLIAVVVLIWSARKLIKFFRANKAEQQMVEGMVQPVGESEPDLSAEELAVLRKRFEEAIAILKNSKGKGKQVNLYELPWYIIIGPPGSGKTTALLNSGLRFPLADRLGQEAVQGVGGTRNCDWWFTDQAVLIDTAGRYLTQDSHAEVDSAAWTGFLDLLKKYRKRRPINGVFVTISLADLMTQDPAERRRHVHAIRQRLDELDTQFGIRFPIYVMLTKSDLIAGFSEFFENLSREDREQVWGTTFPLEDRDGQTSSVEMFGREFDLLVKRLNERLIWRLSQERDVARRAMIYRFPKQMAVMKDLLQDFLSEVFQASRYNQAAMVRGVYFCSGTQEGAPIDRMLGALAQTFSISPQAMSPPQGPGKSFFIGDLLKKIAFNESELAGANRKLEIQRAWLQRAAYAGTVGIAVLALVAWVSSYSRNSSYLETVDEIATETDILIGDISPRNSDPLETVAALNSLRDLAHRNEDSPIQTSWLQGFGLSQESKISGIADDAYRRVLLKAFLARLMLRMEEHMQRGGPSPDYAYAALRAYLSLDSKDHYDAVMINAFLRLDWLENMRREVSADQRKQLEDHLTALLERRPSSLPIPLDDELIARTQTDLLRMPLDERIYGRLLRRPMKEKIQGFNIRDAAGGDAADLVFVRKSGRQISEPLPALFSRTGYQSIFSSTSDQLTREILSESWVLGKEDELSDANLRPLLQKVRDRYLEDYESRFTNLILDIDLAPFTTPDEAARMFRILSRDDSPMLLLLEAVARETDLDSISSEDGIRERTEQRIRDVESGMRDLIGGAAPGSAANRAMSAGNSVAERFRRLNELVVESEDGRPRPIDHLLDLIGKLYIFLSTVSSEAAGGAIPPHIEAQGQALIQELKIEAENQPDLVGQLFDAASQRTQGLVFGGRLKYLNDLWQSGPLSFCQNAIQGRYPIRRSTTNVIRIDDFSRFFGYNQMMDSFFNEHLRPYVDTSRKPWRAKTAGNAPLNISNTALRAFERADQIKQTFFGFGGAAPTVGFNLMPLDMDASLGLFVLNLEGTEIRWDHGPQQSSFMQWPGPNPGSGVRIEMRNAETGRTHMTREQGPWAWFRILDRANIRSSGKLEQFEVEFDVDGYKAIYELVARSAYNPFRFEELEKFSCPGRL